MALGMLPGTTTAKSVTDREFLQWIALFLDVLFIATSASFGAWHARVMGLPGGGNKLGDRFLFVLACSGLVWLGVGLVLPAGGMSVQ